MSSKVTAFPGKRGDTSAGVATRLDLPAPRIWKPKHLAEFLGVSVHWVYKRTEASADDPITRIPGIGRLSFDTHARWHFSSGLGGNLATLTMVILIHRLTQETEGEPYRRRNIGMARRKTYQRGNVQLHNGVWTLRYREFNHATCKWVVKREKLGTFKSKKQARRAAEPIMARVNERNNSDKPPEIQHLTFRQFVEGRWKAYAVSTGHQPSTMDCYGSLLKTHLLPQFGDRQLREIRPIDISDILEGMQVKKLSANSLQSVYSLLRLMFELACQYDLIERSPVRPKLHRPETAKVDKPTLNAQAIRAILAAMQDGQDRLFTLLVALTGIRLGQRLAPRWMDFAAARCELQINHTLYRNRLKPPKTESSRRVIRLVPAVAGVLAAYREQSAFQVGTDFIFCRPDGGPLNPRTIRRHLYAAMGRAEVARVSNKYGFHIFRHTAGILMYTKSRDLKLVQGALGHPNISTTSNIFVHLDDTTMAEGTELLAEEILGKESATCDLFVTKNHKRVS